MVMHSARVYFQVFAHWQRTIEFDVSQSSAVKNSKVVRWKPQHAGQWGRRRVAAKMLCALRRAACSPIARALVRCAHAAIVRSARNVVSVPRGAKIACTTTSSLTASAAVLARPRCGRRQATTFAATAAAEVQRAPPDVDSWLSELASIRLPRADAMREALQLYPSLAHLPASERRSLRALAKFDGGLHVDHTKVQAQVADEANGISLAQSRVSAAALVWRRYCASLSSPAALDASAPAGRTPHALLDMRVLGAYASLLTEVCECSCIVSFLVRFSECVKVSSDSCLSH